MGTMCLVMTRNELALATRAALTKSSFFSDMNLLHRARKPRPTDERNQRNAEIRLVIGQFAGTAAANAIHSGIVGSKW